MTDSLTTTSLLASVTELLLASGYSRVAESKIESTGLEDARAFEDPYGVVIVVAWTTCDALLDEWARGQSILIELISAHYSRRDSKAWDGYTVLLTTAEPTQQQALALDHVRQDTSHTRKIIATGVELRTISDVFSVLATLLPLDIDTGIALSPSVLESLPEIVKDEYVAREVVKSVATAFTDGTPLMEAIHRHMEM